MQNNFDYDFNKHFPVQKKIAIWGNIFLGIGLLAQGAAYVFLQNNSTDSFLFWVGIFILFGGLCIFTFGLNQNKPLVKGGNYYLKIIDNTIYWKLELFQSKREVAFQDIKKIIFIYFFSWFSVFLCLQAVYFFCFSKKSVGRSFFSITKSR